MRTKRGDYFIEPSKHHEVNDAGHHPHVIFQRSAVKVCFHSNIRHPVNFHTQNISFLFHIENISVYFDLQQSNHKEHDKLNNDIKLKHIHSGAGNKANENSEKNENYALQHGRKRELIKHESSNCGTKEPKGPSETHIEWQPEGKVCIE